MPADEPEVRRVPQAFDLGTSPVAFELRTGDLVGSARESTVFDGRRRAFFSGVLHDSRELAASLRLPANATFASILAAAHARDGDAIFGKLRGVFVAAVSDEAAGRAVIARDPAGIAPLFYAVSGSRVHFASEIAPLRRIPGVDRALNASALTDHLCYRWPDRTETFFAGVRRVPPGWRAVIERGAVHQWLSWDPAPIDRELDWLKEADLEQFDALFERAVERCLGPGRTGIFLSGGLDSVSVAANAADIARRRHLDAPLALSLGFTDPSCDERDRQSAAARGLGLDQILVRFDDAVGPTGLFQQNLALNRDLSSPLLNPWQPAYQRLAARGRDRGVHHILTGQRGDEWMTVSPYLAADLVRQGRFRELMRFTRMLRRSYDRPLFSAMRSILWTSALRPLISQELDRRLPDLHRRNRLTRVLRGDPSWLHPDRRRDPRHIARAEQHMTPPDPGTSFYVREMRTGSDHVLVSWELEEEFELGGRTGVRMVHPYADPDLVGWLSRTPPELLTMGGRTKGLVRASLARRFPKLGFERQRKVFATPFFETLLLNDGPAMLAEAGDFPALSRLGIVDGEATRRYCVDRLRAGGARARRIWEPINLEVWARYHLD